MSCTTYYARQVEALDAKFREMYKGKELEKRLTQIPQIIDDSTAAYHLLNRVIHVKKDNGGKYMAHIQAINVDRESGWASVAAKANNGKVYT